ncbi:ester cyclase [Methyloceanibacter sp.]|uniref:ester cyclase n=1 Tax=Methyloceanibacter sp. TaxID=1965321 RepID=UPI003D6CA952
MSVEQNKTVARRFIEEVWNEGRLEVADELLAPNLINHQAAEPTRGREAFKQFIAEFRAANPGVRFTIEDMLGEGDKVATRVTIKSGASGHPQSWTGIGIARIADGQIVEQWADTNPFRA